MLTVCHRKRPKLCKPLLKRTMEYLASRSAAPGVRLDAKVFFTLLSSQSGCLKLIVRNVEMFGSMRVFSFYLPCSPLLVFLKDQASSRLIETVIQLSPKSLLCDLYKNHLKGNMVNLALHPIANFPIQRLTAALAKYKLVSQTVVEQRAESFTTAGNSLHGSSSVSFFAVPEVVRRAGQGRGGHLGRRSHGCDRPAGRKLCRKWREAARDYAVPSLCKPVTALPVDLGTAVDGTVMRESTAPFQF